MNRPKITDELIAAVAAEFCAKNHWTDEQAEDLVTVFEDHMDGYELAKALESDCGWDISVDDVDPLDHFGYEVSEAHRQAVMAWARDNNIQPPLPIGTMTTRGEITGIFEHDGATYLVREPGQKDDSRRLLVRFEDARPAKEAELPVP